MIVKAIKQEKTFEPITVQFTLETEEEAIALRKFFGYNVTMPSAASVAMRNAGSDADTVEAQQNIISRLLGNIRDAVRDAQD